MKTLTKRNPTTWVCQCLAVFALFCQPLANAQELEITVLKKISVKPRDAEQAQEWKEQGVAPIAYNLRVKNISESPVDVYVGNFALETEDSAYSHALFVVPMNTKQATAKGLKPGETTMGGVGFEVEKGTRLPPSAKITYRDSKISGIPAPIPAGMLN